MFNYNVSTNLTVVVVIVLVVIVVVVSVSPAHASGQIKTACAFEHMSLIVGGISSSIVVVVVVIVVVLVVVVVVTLGRATHSGQRGPLPRHPCSLRFKANCGSARLPAAQFARARPLPRRAGLATPSPRGSSSYSSTRSVTCATGYPGTATSLMCRADGIWSTSQGCCLTGCCCTPLASTGYVLGTGTGLTTSSTYAMKCVQGYQTPADYLDPLTSTYLTSPGSIVCQSSGSWAAATGCVIIDCRAPVFAGYVFGLYAATTYLNIIAATCEPG